MMANIRSKLRTAENYKRKKIVGSNNLSMLKFPVKNDSLNTDEIEERSHKISNLR